MEESVNFIVLNLFKTLIFHHTFPASIAFVDVGRSRGIFRKNECNYANLLASYFGDSCAPGAKDVLHDQKFRQTSPEAESLCKLCERQSSVPFNVNADVGAKPLTRSSAKADMIVQPDEEPVAETVAVEKKLDAAPARVVEAPLEVAAEVEKVEQPEVEEPEDVQEDEDDYDNDTETVETAKSRRRRQATYGACAPTRSNKYFGTRGAIRCFAEAGDVAIVEIQKLHEIVNELGLDTEDYRIMCRNGTVVPINNFNVDAGCPLVTIVDGEIVVKRGEQKVQSIRSALYSFDQYFQIRDDPSFKPYGKYNGQENLLFEVSTVNYYPISLDPSPIPLDLSLKPDTLRPNSDIHRP